MMNRKTTYLGLLLFAAVLCGCSEEQVEEPALPQIETHPVGLLVEGELSKGVVTTDPKSIHSLGIIGYSTNTLFDEAIAPEPNLFDNVHAERMIDEESGELTPWYYTPAVYWPSNVELKNTFFAYSPYTACQDELPEDLLSVVTDNGSPQIIYSVPEAMSEQIDLLYSDSAYVSNINYESNSGNVTFKMKHALLWLRFMIAPVIENLTPKEGETESYTITEFNMTADRIINTGQFDMRTAKWSKIDDLPDSNNGYEGVNYEFDNLWEEPLTVEAGKTYPMGGLTYEHCLMIIPQSIVLSENATAVNVAFTHDDASGDPSNTEHYITMPFPDVKLDKAGYVMTFIVKLSISGAWIEFRDSNPIDVWLENSEKREIETF